MYMLRRMATRRAGGFEKLYFLVDWLVRALAPLLMRVGVERLERPAAWLEAWSKGALFDCRMCGRCVLAKTGMTCPMNCPKGLRNGPCGGVRADGNCEIEAAMACVWLEAWRGAARMRGGAALAEFQPPVDQRLKGRSAWLRRIADRGAS
jgi:hypothetical protein